MADKDLEIVLTADVEQASKAIENFAKTVGIDIKKSMSIYDAFEEKLKDVEKQLKEASDPAIVAKLTKELGSLNNGIKNIKAGNFDQLGAGLGKVSGSASKAGESVINLGRIAQDASFGFMGVANNIEPFILSLRGLSAQTGGAGSAVKALLGAMAGPAGFGILIGVIQLIDSYSNNLGIFSDKSEKAAKAQKDLNDEFNKFRESAGKELSAINTLRTAMEDTAAPMKVRLEAVKQLQEKYPAYLSNVSQEALLAGKAGTAYDALSQSILKAAKARAAEDVIGKIAADNLRLEESRLKVLTKTNQELADAKTKKFSSIVSTEGGDIVVTAEEDRQITINKILERRVSALKLIDDALASNTERAKFFQGFIEKGTVDLIKLQETVAKGVDNTDVLNEWKEVMSFKAPTLTPTLGLNAGARAAVEEYKAFVKQVVAETTKLPPATATASQQLMGMLTTQQAILANISTQTQEAIEQSAIDKAVANTTAAFNLLGPAIDQAFNALANGTSPIEAVGQALKQMIVQLIKAVVQAAILAAVLNAIAPGSSAGNFGSIFGKLLGFGSKAGRANGGPVNAGQAYMVGEVGPELFVPSGSGSIVSNIGGMSTGGTLTAQISGNDLLFILNNASRNRGSNFG